MSYDWNDDGLEPHEREDYHDAMADKADRMRDEMRIDGSWLAWNDWRAKRAADGLTGSALSLGEWQRQQLENEARA